MIRYRPAELELDQYENAVLIKTLDFLQSLKDDGFESDGVYDAYEGLSKFVGTWCTDCTDEEMQLRLVHPVKGWKNQ